MELFALKQLRAGSQTEQVLLWRPHVVDNNTEQLIKKEARWQNGEVG